MHETRLIDSVFYFDSIEGKSTLRNVPELLCQPLKQQNHRMAFRPVDNRLVVPTELEFMGIFG
jgi:hypothetical protein